MKRVAIPIETDELCYYGCGCVAKYRNGSGNAMCQKSFNSCPAIKKKNSERNKEAYSSGKRIPASLVYHNLPEETKTRINWNKNNFSADFRYNGKGNHKQVLILERGHCCETCQNFLWNGIKITLELEHIDGDNKNNIKDNLKLLCPNCHSQTPTWRGRNNTGKQKVSDYRLLESLKSNKNIRQALLEVGLAAKAGNYERCYKLLNNAGLMELVDIPGLSPGASA